MNLRLRRQANAGPAAARNLGAQLAQGSLLAFTDDDCEPEQDWLTQLVAGINQHPQGLIGGRTLNGLRENCFSVASQVLIDYLYAQGLKGRMMNPFFASNNIALAR